MTLYKSTNGTRGKTAEGKVRDALMTYAKSSSFDFYRPPDARAGSLNDAPADFITTQKANHGLTRVVLLEVKEVAHDYRLPKKNFPSDQRARMRKWRLTNAEGFVMILHTTTGLWRLLPLSYFDNDFENTGSWNLADILTGSLPQIMEAIYTP